MRHSVLILVLAVALGCVLSGMAMAQAPTGVEAQSIWDAFWSRVAAGDLDGARRYVHTTRQGSPWRVSGGELQAMARQMQRCRLRPDPLPESGEDVLFQVRCEHAGESVEMLVGLREDVDGAWRLTVM